MEAHDPVARDELIRVRSRLHSLEKADDGLVLRIVSLEGRVSSLEATREEFLPKIRELLDDERIDAAVAVRLKQRGTVVPIGWLPKLIVLLVGLSAIGSFVLSIVHAAGGN